MPNDYSCKDKFSFVSFVSQFVTIGNSFHIDTENIKSNLIKNAYPSFVIDKIIKRYLDQKFSSSKNQIKDTSDVKFTSDVYYFKLSYIGNLLDHIKNKFFKLCKHFCKKKINIKLFIDSFKIENYNDPIPKDLNLS